jgi:hypothetical protein
LQQPEKQYFSLQAGFVLVIFQHELITISPVAL